MQPETLYKSNGEWRGGGFRRATNTPVQATAADLVMCAMIRVEQCKELKDLGFKLLL